MNLELMVLENPSCAPAPLNVMPTAEGVPAFYLQNASLMVTHCCRSLFLQLPVTAVRFLPRGRSLFPRCSSSAPSGQPRSRCTTKERHQLLRPTGLRHRTRCTPGAQQANPSVLGVTLQDRMHSPGLKIWRRGTLKSKPTGLKEKKTTLPGCFCWLWKCLPKV